MPLVEDGQVRRERVGAERVRLEEGPARRIGPLTNFDQRFGQLGYFVRYEVVVHAYCHHQRRSGRAEVPLVTVPLDELHIQTTTRCHDTWRVPQQQIHVQLVLDCLQLQVIITIYLCF